VKRKHNNNNIINNNNNKYKKLKGIERADSELKFRFILTDQRWTQTNGYY